MGGYTHIPRVLTFGLAPFLALSLSPAERLLNLFVTAGFLSGEIPLYGGVSGW